MLPTAKPENLLVVRSDMMLGFERVITVDCTDYDVYKGLPRAVSIGNDMFGLTGWNSDLQVACYKTGVLLAKPID